MTEDAYAELLVRTKEVWLLESTADVLSWDQETKMPAGGVEQRADQLAQLARLAHERATDPRLGELLDMAGDSVGDGDRAVDLREARRDYARRVEVPADLVEELAETASKAQHAWAAAREASDWPAFAPWLEKLVGLARSRAACLGVPDGGELWDALAEDYEPGMRAAELEGLFGPLRVELSELVRELGEGRVPSSAFQKVRVPAAEQEAFVRHVIAAMGFDFARGRLDRSAHPFCSGTSPGDVRLTTRFHEAFLGDALGSTMHEAGHGLYEQGLPPDAVGRPRGGAVSLGIHESQSRLWENHVGRSRAFWTWCAPLLSRFCGDRFAGFSVDDLFGAANVVRPSLIRVEADEATYNLHVVIRFELERALIRGELAVADVPGAWNDGYRAVLGVDVPDDRRGCLQDVHWSCGMFGYFPTYTLGSLYAAQFHAAAERAIPDLDGRIEKGEFAPLLEWLRAAVHVHGRRYRADRLCERATGKPLDPGVMLAYLRTKLEPLYGLPTG